MLSRRNFLKNLGFTATTLAGLPPLAAAFVDKKLTQTSIAELYRKSIVIDTLVNTGPYFSAKEAIEAGLTALVADLSIYPRNTSNAFQALTEWSAAFKRADSAYLKVLKAADLAIAKQQGKLGIMLACQDASILDASTGSVSSYNIDNLAVFYDLGLRVLQITHNERNSIGDAYREKTDAGLSRLGENVVAAMNTLGMIVDLSHCSDRTTLSAIQLSKKPCAITHAGCRALHPTLRNKTDEEIKALADKGGVFGVFNMTLWLTERDTTSINDVLDHIDHAVKIGGIEHVAFGSDGPALQLSIADELAGMKDYARRNLGLPGSEKIPDHCRVPELNSPKRLFNLADGLSKRGYKSDAVEKIIGGNFVRLFKDVCG